MIDVELHANLPPAGVSYVTQWVLTDLDVDHVLVRVFNTDHWHQHGHFYCRPTSVRPYRILAYVPLQVNGHGLDRGLRGGPPPISPRNWQESLVCILAHEGMHCRQYLRGPRTPGYIQNRKGKRVHVSGRIFSEVEAEWAEYRFLQRWRERKS